MHGLGCPLLPVGNTFRGLDNFTLTHAWSTDIRPTSFVEHMVTLQLLLTAGMLTSNRNKSGINSGNVAADVTAAACLQAVQGAQAPLQLGIPMFQLHIPQSPMSVCGQFREWRRPAECDHCHEHHLP